MDRRSANCARTAAPCPRPLIRLVAPGLCAAARPRRQCQTSMDRSPPSLRKVSERVHHPVQSLLLRLPVAACGRGACLAQTRGGHRWQRTDQTNGAERSRSAAALAGNQGVVGHCPLCPLKSRMITRFRTLPLRPDRDPLDASLSRWGCILGGLGLCILALLTLRQSAASKLEFLFGATLSVVDCLLLFLLGALGRRVHLAV